MRRGSARSQGVQLKEFSSFSLPNRLKRPVKNYGSGRWHSELASDSPICARDIHELKIAELVADSVANPGFTPRPVLRDPTYARARPETHRVSIVQYLDR